MSAFEIKTPFYIELVFTIQLFPISTVRLTQCVNWSTCVSHQWFSCALLYFTPVGLAPWVKINFEGILLLLKNFSHIVITPSWSVTPTAKLSCLLQALLMQNWVVKVLKGLILHQESRFLESCLKSQLYNVWISLLNLFHSIVI